VHKRPFKRLKGVERINPASVYAILGLLHWIAPTGLLHWIAPLDCSTGLLHWIAPLDCSDWIAPLDCSTGLLHWTAPLDCSDWIAPLDSSTGLLRLDCSTGMLHWIALTGLLLTCSAPFYPRAGAHRLVGILKKHDKRSIFTLPLYTVNLVGEYEL
jgi:hypothetical protein